MKKLTKPKATKPKKTTAPKASTPKGYSFGSLKKVKVTEGKSVAYASVILSY